MFLPRFLVDKFAAFTERGLDRIILAKHEQCAAVLAVKDQQIHLLNSVIDDLRHEVIHERARAEAAIDTLLQEKANVAGIRNADLARERALAAEKDGSPLQDPNLQEMQRIFQSVGGVGDDADATEAERREDATTRFAAIGGLAIT